jgi:hypothetical protein
MLIYLNFLRAKKIRKLTGTGTIQVGQDLQFLSIVRGLYLVQPEKMKTLQSGSGAYFAV